MPDVRPIRPGDPRRVSRYRLTARLGSTSGTGHASSGVFLARAPDGGRVVVTLLGEDRTAGPAAGDRFTAEAQAARRIVPWCAARVLDAGIEGTWPYLVCEFVPGPSLREVVAEQGPLPPDILGALAIGTATGLTAIHQAGLVHGRLGPGHVVLSPDGPLIVHAGITPPYGTATPAADLLAWAKMLLFAAAGRPPVGPQDLAALPDGLSAIVSPCLDPVPAGRPPARTVLAWLLGDVDLPDGPLAEGARRARAARAPAGVALGPRGATRRRARSRAVAWGLGCAACMAAIGVAAYAEWPGSPASRGSAMADAPASLHAVSPSATAAVPAALAGHWSGPVHQTHPTLTVTVQIALSPGSATGSIAYPALGCSGKLAVVSGSGDSLTLAQTIGAGRDNCDNGVIMLVLRPGGTLEFSFRRHGGATPRGTLTRQGRPG